jgi:putative addiction module component (TIGR02574 family)
MNTNLSQELLNLSVAERIQLAEDIWNSVAQKPEDVVVTAAQIEELDRRLERFAQGATPARSWEEVKESLTSRVC